MRNLQATNSHATHSLHGSWREAGRRAVLSLAALICLSAGAAWAGSVGPTFIPPYDFDQSGKSDVLLHRLMGANAGINQTQIIEGTSMIARGWPDLNVGPGGTVQYVTLGAGRFDPGLGTQAQIVTRMTSAGTSPGMIRIVKLELDGISPFVGPNKRAQWFVAGTDLDWAFVGIGDCNDDSADDIVYHKIAGANIGLIRIVFMDPAKPLERLVTRHPGLLPSGYVPIGVGDADGDGQADVWARDGDVVQVLINADTVVSGAVADFDRAEMPVVLPPGYTVRGIGYFNRADGRADLITQNDSGDPTDLGLVRIDNTGDDGGSTNATTSFPMMLNVVLGETVAGIGDYDGMNQQDLMTRLFTPAVPANAGNQIVRLMDSDGTDLAGVSAGLSPIVNLDYEVVSGAPVLAP